MDIDVLLSMGVVAISCDIEHIKFMIHMTKHT